MAGVSYFTYNGHKSTDFGLVISNPVETNSGAQAAVEVVTIPGRAGALTINSDRRDEIEIVYEVWGRAGYNEHRANFMRKIKAWLLQGQGKYFDLSDTYDPEYYWRARYVGDVVISQDYYRIVSMQLQFLAYPYKFSLEGNRTIHVTGDALSNYSINNPEAFDSAPYFKIIGRGDLALKVNGKVWRIKDVTQYVEMDCGQMNTYVGGVSYNDKKTGEGYPMLKPGNNTIVCSDTITALDIRPRWRTL